MSPIDVETYVPKPLRKPGWSRDYPKNKNPWSAERDVFWWLFPTMGLPQGCSIESRIRLFEEFVTAPPSLAGAGWLRRWLARNDHPCAHGIQTRFKKCSACTAQHQECIAYLHALKTKAHAFHLSRDYWLSLDPYEFEAAVARLFRDTGLDAEVTRGSGDGGVDVFVRSEGVLIAVQCKQHRNPVGPAVARELLGAMSIHGAQQAILVCTGGFTAGVHQLARDDRLKLYDLDGLIELQRSVTITVHLMP